MREREGEIFSTTGLIDMQVPVAVEVELKKTEEVFDLCPSRSHGME